MYGSFIFWAGYIVSLRIRWDDKSKFALTCLCVWNPISLILLEANIVRGQWCWKTNTKNGLGVQVTFHILQCGNLLLSIWSLLGVPSIDESLIEGSSASSEVAKCVRSIEFQKLHNICDVAIFLHVVGYGNPVLARNLRCIVERPVEFSQTGWCHKIEVASCKSSLGHLFQLFIPCRNGRVGDLDRLEGLSEALGTEKGVCRLDGVHVFM